MDERFKQFFVEATNAFQFLEQVYGYRRSKEILESPHEMRDTVAKLRYVGPLVGVEIIWYFANATLQVSLVELLKENVFPKYYSYFQVSPSDLKKHGVNPSDTARAVDLEDLVEMLGQKEKAGFLLYYGSHNRGQNKRMKMIENNRKEIIAGLAHATQIYVTPILLGDTSIFPQVMQYLMEKRKKQGLPDLF